MKRSILFLAQNVWVAIVQFAYLITVSRLFTPKDFGYFIVEFSLIALLSTIGSAGFSQIVFSNRSESENFIVNTLKRALGSGLVLVLIGSLLVYPWFLLWRAEIFWIGMFGPLVVLVVTPAFNLASSLLRANYSPAAAVSSQVTAFTFGYVVATYMCYLTQNPVYLFAAQAISQSTVVFAYIFLARRDWVRKDILIGANSQLKGDNYVSRARQIAGISYLTNNLFRWTTSFQIGSAALGQLNRSEAFTAGTIGLFQNAFTSTVASKGDKGKKLYAQDANYVAEVVATYALVTLCGSLFLSNVIESLLIGAIGPQWQIAATLSQYLIIGWAGYSVLSVVSFVHETKADWKNALKVQVLSLFVAGLSSIFLWATNNLVLAAALFGYASLLLAALVSRHLSQGALMRLIKRRDWRRNSPIFGSLACLLTVSLANLWFSDLPVLIWSGTILGLGFTMTSFFQMVKNL